LRRRPPFAARKDIFTHYPFLTHSEFGHDPARGQILDAALSKRSVQAEDGEAVAQHCAANLGRKTTPSVG
jgi:hypothetical protein